MPFVFEDKQFVRKRGSRREVLDGICFCTSGGLVADQLEDRNGKIISKRRSAMGKERYASKNPFKNVDEAEPDEKVEEVKPKKKRKRVTVETTVPVRVPVARKKRTQARRRKK